MEIILATVAVLNFLINLRSSVYWEKLRKLIKRIF